MCEHSEKLIAWLDHELTGDEMACVEQHVRDCVECRGQIDACRKVSRTFDAYCDAVMEAKAERRAPRWVPVLSSVAAVVFAAVLLLFVRNTRRAPVVPPAGENSPLAALVEPVVKSVVEPAPEATHEAAPTVSGPVHRRREPVRVVSENVNWTPIEPAIQIVMPAESMFPPGAVPEGFAFTADLSLAADGSAQQIRLRPQLVGFERRINQP
jgi:anti-sigma factor RsiW